MMMPANFSAIAETEMTYVVGGGLEAYLAPVMTAANWQTFNTNLITIIGNTYMQNFLDSTLGVLFSGSYTPFQIAGVQWTGVADAYGTGKGAVKGFEVGEDDKFAGVVTGVNSVLAGANGVLNAALSVAKSAAVIYTLGHGSAASKHTSSVVGFTSF